MAESGKRARFLSPGEFTLIALVFIAVLGFLYYIFFTPNYYSQPAPIRFEIRKGETLSHVIDNLYKKGIIPSKLNMRIASFVYGADTRIRAARYYIPNGLSYLDLVELFIRGDADFLKSVKIFDGMDTEWIASRMRTDLLIDSADFMSHLDDDSLVNLINSETNSLNGYLLPEEYFFFERSSPSEILREFITEFNKFVDDSLKRQAQFLNLPVHDIITIASIVEGETNDPDEMPLIAGVYYNRLRIGMRLQADPTIQYILKDWRRLTYKDLLLDSKFNTYKYAGIPPHPINNPGKNAILAAFNPVRHKYLYFVADTSGGHKFSESFTEHTRYAREYRKWLDKQKQR